MDSVSRTPGRPRGVARTQRERLLAAAVEVLTQERAGQFTLAQVARAARVTPALAHYYFTDREGLLEALLGERVAPLIDDVVAAARMRAGQPQHALTFLMQRATSLLASHLLLRRCVWLPQPAAVRLRERLRGCLHELLVRGQEIGALRADLTPDYLADALLGLVLLPYLDEPQAQVAGERVTQLMLQHVALLRDGIVRADKSPSGH